VARARKKLVVVDVGNSEIVVGIFVGEQLDGRWRLGSRPRTPDEVVLLLNLLFAEAGVRTAGLQSVISSVVPPATRRFSAALERITGREPVVVGERDLPQLPVDFLDPSSIGPDRLANAMAVRACYGTPAVVVDLGTATTFDVVGQDGEYVGGAIAPGVWTSSEELFRRAARLSRVELVVPPAAIGKTTEESLCSGIVLGMAGMVDSLVRRISAELSARPRVVATGGMATLIAPACETIETVDEWLTLQGLRLIHEANGRSAKPAKPRRAAKKPASKSGRRPGAR
jgi:type III pantothenate kinase